MMESSKASEPAFTAPRRTFTAPIYPSGPQHDGVVETLYDHPSVKIVSFTAGSRQVSFGSALGSSQPPDVEPGSLSWSSHLERTIALGQFRIYRAPGSVAFLNCGSVLQPILPKSQVWCVDEDSSKFILQIRRPQYWRIEVPVASSDDAHRAQLLREVFGKILQFEKTECPFRRSFTVELPEPPHTPVKKRPWTPAQRPYPALPPTPDHTPVELARVRRDIPHLEPISIPETQESLSDPEKGSDRGSDHKKPAEAGSSPENRSDGGGNPESNSNKIETSAGLVQESLPLPKTLKLGTALPALRSVTAPPQLTLHASPPSKVREEGQTEPPTVASESQSPGDSPGSFHSVKSWDASSLPPSPPLSNPASPLGSSCPSEVAGESLNQEDPPELASISDSSPTWCASPTSDFDSSVTAPSSIYDAVETSSTCSKTAGEEDTPQTPILAAETPLDTSTSALSSSPLSESAAAEITQRPPIRRRGTTSSSISPSRRALSPLPSAANLFAPRRPFGSLSSATRGKLDVVRRIPMAIIQTTCEILMSPPSHLINLMLKVAARIAAGEWRGFVFGTNEHGEQIPVHWDWSDDEDTDGPSSSWNPGLRKNSLGWLPITSQKMAGTFPESDDEESDHHDEDLVRTLTSTFLNQKEGIVQEATRTDSTPLNATASEDWSGSLGVD